MLYGVDVHARYQAGLDIPLLAQQGYTFLSTKATEGLGVVAVPGFTAEQFTTRMLRWVEQARQAGMVPGLYHYLRAQDGAAQCDVFWRIVQRAGGPAGMLIQLDCEADGFGPQMSAWAGRWRELTGGHPFLIYSGAWWWPRTGGFNGAGLTPYLWHSRYLTADADTIPDDPAAFAARIPTSWWQVTYGGWTRPTILQFTSRGDAGSLGNNVDLNATHLTREQLNTLTRKDDDMATAPEIWGTDINPAADGSYSAGGALWTVLARTGLLNQLPSLVGDVAALKAAQVAQEAKLDQILAALGTGGNVREVVAAALEAGAAAARAAD